MKINFLIAFFAIYFCGAAILIEREWKNFPVVSNYPPNYPHTNPVPNFNRVYKVGADGSKELIGGPSSKKFSFEVVGASEPRTLVANSDSIQSVPPNSGVTTFVLEAIRPIWITNAHWQYYYWVANYDGTSPSEEVDIISYPWITWNIPPGNFVLEWTNDFLLWFPVEIISGPATKIIDIDVRIPHRFFRIVQI